MDIILVVTRPFGQNSVGDRITAPDDIAAILASEHANNVVAVKPTARTGEE